MEPKDIIALVSLAIGLMVGLVASLQARRHDREQQGRGVLLQPAVEFAKSALRVLAALRYVTPPKYEPDSRYAHRNEAILVDHDERARRFERCQTALDVLRADRAHIRLVFHPKSWAASHSALVLGYLRACLEQADMYYARYDEVVGTGASVHRWRLSDGQVFRDQYKDWRGLTYESLEQFHLDVAERLVRPTWNPRQIDGPRPPEPTLVGHEQGATPAPATPEEAR